MATATLKAKLIEDICTKRIAALDVEYETDASIWKENKLRQVKWRGRWPWRYSYYPTEAEVDEDFVTDHGWNPSARYWLKSNRELQQNPLLKIQMVARESIERGDGKITLNADEIQAIRRAISANGDDIQPELESS